MTDAAGIAPEGVSAADLRRWWQLSPATASTGRFALAASVGLPVAPSCPPPLAQTGVVAPPSADTGEDAEAVHTDIDPGRSPGDQFAADRASVAPADSPDDSDLDDTGLTPGPERAAPRSDPPPGTPADQPPGPQGAAVDEPSGRPARGAAGAGAAPPRAPAHRIPGRYLLLAAAASVAAALSLWLAGGLALGGRWPTPRAFVEQAYERPEQLQPLNPAWLEDARARLGDGPMAVSLARFAALASASPAEEPVGELPVNLLVSWLRLRPPSADTGAESGAARAGVDCSRARGLLQNQLAWLSTASLEHLLDSQCLDPAERAAARLEHALLHGDRAEIERSVPNALHQTRNAARERLLDLLAAHLGLLSDDALQTAVAALANTQDREAPAALSVLRLEAVLRGIDRAPDPARLVDQLDRMLPTSPDADQATGPLLQLLATGWQLAARDPDLAALYLELLSRRLSPEWLVRLPASGKARLLHGALFVFAAAPEDFRLRHESLFRDLLRRIRSTTPRITEGIDESTAFLHAVMHVAGCWMNDACALDAGLPEPAHRGLTTPLLPRLAAARVPEHGSDAETGAAVPAWPQGLLLDVVAGATADDLHWCRGPNNSARCLTLAAPRDNAFRRALIEQTWARFAERIRPEESRTEFAHQLFWWIDQRTGFDLFACDLANRQGGPLQADGSVCLPPTGATGQNTAGDIDGTIAGLWADVVAATRTTDRVKLWATLIVGDAVAEARDRAFSDAGTTPRGYDIVARQVIEEHWYFLLAQPALVQQLWRFSNQEKWL
jgi:hypothetical protein